MFSWPIKVTFYVLFRTVVFFKVSKDTCEVCLLNFQVLEKIRWEQTCQSFQVYFGSQFLLSATFEGRAHATSLISIFRIKGDAFWPKKTFPSSSGTKSFLQSVFSAKNAFKQKKRQKRKPTRHKFAAEGSWWPPGKKSLKISWCQFSKNVPKNNFDVLLTFWCFRWRIR